MSTPAQTQLPTTPAALAKQAAQAPAEPQMTPQDAHGILLNNALMPLYFAKLAEYGRQPATEEDAMILAQMGQQALAAREQGLLKAASTQDSIVKRAAARLNAHVQGQVQVTPDQQDSAWAKQAAAELMRAPGILPAIVTYQTALLGPQQQAA